MLNLIFSFIYVLFSFLPLSTLYNNIYETTEAAFNRKHNKKIELRKYKILGQEMPFPINYAIQKFITSFFAEFVKKTLK